METEKDKTSMFQNKTVISLGYGRHDAATNMAIDEAMLNLSSRSGKFFLRFYDFDKPSIVLSNSDHPDSIIMENLNGTSVTKRQTAGRPIYLDRNTFSYSITGHVPIGNDVPHDWDFKSKVHSHFGTIIASVIKAMANPEHVVEIGKHKSVVVDGRPIAGHAITTVGHYSFLYHGVLGLDQWDAAKINSLLRIRYKDFEEIGRLPSINSVAKIKSADLSEYRRRFMDLLLDSMGQIQAIEPADESELLGSAAKLAKQKYSNEDWFLRKDDNLKVRLRFCMCSHLDD